MIAVGNKTSKSIVLALTFIIGFCVVGMEIASSRLLAPEFGTSIFVWSNIIAVVLLALSIGYYLGGKLAEKQPNFYVLSTLTAIAGFIFLAVPKLNIWITQLGFKLIYDPIPSNIGFALTTFAVGLLLFGPGLILLGMTSPMLVKIYNLSNNKVGESAGLVFAVSTLGSILGTILPTFWMLPDFGTRTTIFVFGSLLLVVSLLSWSQRKTVASVLAAVLILAVYQAPDSGFALKILYQGESAYHHIKVVEDQDQSRYLVFNEGLSLESVYPKDKILTGAFYDYFNLLPSLFEKPEPVKVLVLGLAGGTLLRQLNYFYGDRVEIDAVEIDPEVVRVGYQYFDLDKLNFHLIEDDGRIYLKNTEKNYDIIMVDVFQNELYIPWTFTTEEFWQLVKNRLTADGLVAINAHSSNEGELLSAISNTQAKIFSNVYRTGLTGFARFSYMLVASGRELDYGFNQQLPVELAEIKGNVKETKKISFDPSKSILTDDRAPVEKLSEHSIGFYRKFRPR